MARNSDTSTNVRVNSIVEGTSLRGDVKAPGNFRIDGSVTGTITIEGRLIIGAKGRVEGQVVCKDAEVEGVFSGELQVNGLLALKSSSKIEGEAVFQRLSVEEGAELKCTCNLKNAGEKKRTSTAPSIHDSEPMKAL